MSAFGRLSVMSATPSRGREVRMCSYCFVDMTARRRRLPVRRVVSVGERVRAARKSVDMIRGP